MKKNLSGSVSLVSTGILDSLLIVGLALAYAFDKIV